MALIDFLKSQINEKGWLAISSLYFDNGYVLNVFNTRGYVAYSDAMECFFSYNALDSTDSESVENKYSILRYEHFGMTQVITAVGYDHLQHIDLAQYSHYNFYNDAQEETPYPKIPTKDEITALTPDPETGLYPGTDTITKMSGEPTSAIPMYNDFFDPYVKNEPYSGARVDHWQTFYKNQEKFVTLLAAAYGVSDAK